jgi:hypothetical protein
MNKKLASGLLLISLIVLPTTMSTVSATDYTKVGVRVGDTADYTYSSPAANGTLDVRRFRIEILQIAGTNVTIDIRELYLNNSEGPDNTVADNVSSSVNQMLFSPYIRTFAYYHNNLLVKSGKTYPAYLVVAGLSQGDNLFPDFSPSTWSPIDTITMYVAGQNRIVNQVTYIGIILAPAPINMNFYSNKLYYDKDTGLLVESNITVGFYSGEKDRYIATLNSTTAFATFPPLSPGEKAIAPLVFTAGIAVVAVVMVAVAIAQRRQRKTTTN